MGYSLSETAEVGERFPSSIFFAMDRHVAQSLARAFGFVYGAATRLLIPCVLRLVSGVTTSPACIQSWREVCNSTVERPVFPAHSASVPSQRRGKDSRQRRCRAEQEMLRT